MATRAGPRQFTKADNEYRLVNRIQAKVLDRLQNEDGEFVGVSTD